MRVILDISFDGRSLNPCSNGRYSRRKLKIMDETLKGVLILVLMEDTLGG